MDHNEDEDGKGGGYICVHQLEILLQNTISTEDGAEVVLI